MHFAPVVVLSDAARAELTKDLLESRDRLRSEDTCRDYLTQLRWPKGCTRPKCRGRQFGETKGRRGNSPASSRHRKSGRNGLTNAQQRNRQESPVSRWVEAEELNDPLPMEFGGFWSFSHFSMAVSVIPSPSSLASCVIDREMSIR